MQHSLNFSIGAPGPLYVPGWVQTGTIIPEEILAGYREQVNRSIYENAIRNGFREVLPYERAKIAMDRVRYLVTDSDEMVDIILTEIQQNNLSPQQVWEQIQLRQYDCHTFEQYILLGTIMTIFDEVLYSGVIPDFV